MKEAKVDAANRSTKKSEGNSSAPKKRRRRVLRFPSLPFEQPKELAFSLFENGSGQPVRRLTLFDAMGKSPESGPSRTLITSASKYGLITGSAQSETLELTEDGRKVVDESFPRRDRAMAAVNTAIKSVDAYSQLYNRFKGNRLPTTPVLIDAIQDYEIEQDEADQAVDIFLQNLKTVDLLQTLSGAERILSEEHLADEIARREGAQEVLSHHGGIEHQAVFSPPITSGQANLETTTFYITPIGSEGSIERKHSDLFLSSLIEPAVAKFGLKVVRADQIDKPGVITRQVMQYLIEARLVIADLSFSNPNVFYELAVRHMAKKPVVQTIQKSDRIPFDVNQLRTIVIDNTDIYTWTPKLELWQSEISNQIRQALDDPESVESPVDWYLSSQKVRTD